jgi:hypothetical protein
MSKRISNEETEENNDTVDKLEEFINDDDLDEDIDEDEDNASYEETFVNR